ncbi:hypothetical protein PG984_011023 [Apiospora sp. TS-2023a]
MCHITQLHCEVCQANSRHLFLPCEDFLSENVRDENGEVKNHIEPGKRFYCSDLKWPPDPDEDNSYWVCNACFESGRQTFKDSMKVVAWLNDPSASQSDYVSRLRDKLPNSQTDKSSGEGHLPVEFDDLAGTTRENLVLLYSNKEFPDHLWDDRIASTDNCYMTIWMPCCPVCKDPMVSPRRRLGIIDVEIEPTSELWRWLAVHQRLAPAEAQAFEINVATGFISKVCAICRNMETVLRQQVHNHLQDTTHPRSWAITMWLLGRGLLGKTIYDFNFLNVGLPDTMPPPIKDIMGLMAKSWKGLTNGIAFGDCVVDSGPPVSYSASLTRHSKPLLHLDQWVRLVDPYSDKELNVNRPPQSLDIMAGSDEIASLISNMPADGPVVIDHDFGMDAEDDNGRNGEDTPDRSDGSDMDQAEEDDNSSVSSDTSYTSYEPPADLPEFHFHPKKLKEYIMPWRGFVDMKSSHMSEPYGISTTSTLERIAIGSVDPIIALWHILGNFIETLPTTKTKKHHGHTKADWEEAHTYLGTIVKFVATVREHPEKKYKHKSLRQLGHTRKIERVLKILDTLVTDVVRESGYESEDAHSDISELPVDVLAYYHRSIAEGLLDLCKAEMSCSEGENGSLLVTIRGLSVYNSERTTQRYRIPREQRQLHVLKFEAPSFKESFADAAKEGKFVGVMRRTLFGEVAAGKMHGERRVVAHSRVEKTPDNESHSATKAKNKDAQNVSALANGRKSSTKKHVHFASSPNLVQEAESPMPWWEMDQNAAGPSTENEGNGSAPDEDALMADADVIDFDDGEGAFVLCNKGGWHYHDNQGSPMGEQISLPGLGLEYTY